MNGEVKQNGTTSDMIFKIPALIEHVSSIMSLEVGLSYFCLLTPPSPRSGSASGHVHGNCLQNLGAIPLIPIVLPLPSEFTWSSLVVDFSSPSVRGCDPDRYTVRCWPGKTGR